MNRILDTYNINDINKAISIYNQKEKGEIKELKNSINNINKDRKNLDKLKEAISDIKKGKKRNLSKSNYKYNVKRFENFIKEHINNIQKLALNKGYVLKYTINDGNKKSNSYVTLNNEQITEITEILEGKKLVDVSNQLGGSDLASEITALEYGEYEILPKRINKENNGGYFNFINISDEDLSELQIYNEVQFYLMEKERRINCLYFSLSKLFAKNNIPNDKLAKLKNFGLAGNITSSNLKEIANKLDINIVLTTHVNKQLRHKSFGKKTNTKIELALYKNHYFINDDNQYNKINLCLKIINLYIKHVFQKIINLMIKL